jgi:hypothetical protein
MKVFMPRIQFVVALGLVLLPVSGCGGGAPYVLSTVVRDKPGQVEVCYDHNKSTLAEAQKLADGECIQYDRVAQFTLQQFNQCNWKTPDIALFACVARPGEKPLPIPPIKGVVH